MKAKIKKSFDLSQKNLFGASSPPFQFAPVLSLPNAPVGQNSGCPLDTLAQLPQPYSSKGFEKRESLRKRARSKYFSAGLALKLIDVQKSKLLKSYWNSFYCCGVLKQDGNKITGKYCGTRWCLVCNRIRTAKLVNGYTEPLSKLVHPYFVTLTVPNVSGTDLRDTIDSMTVALREIKKKYQKIGVNFTGIRKVECTYNGLRNDFHPHFHLLISGGVQAKLLLYEWLKHFPEADRKGQDYKRADKKSVKEIFKYFTKLVTKTYDEKGTVVRKRIEVSAMDKIFSAMQNLRVFQPMGIVKDQDGFMKFVNQIKQTYSLRKKPIVFNLPEERATAIFTTSMQTNDNTNASLRSLFDNIKAPALRLEAFKQGQLPGENISFLKSQLKKAIYETDIITNENINYKIEVVGLEKKICVNTFNKNDLVQWFDEWYSLRYTVDVKDDVDEMQSQIITGLKDEKAEWIWKYTDWIKVGQSFVDIETGELIQEKDECLSGYEPNEAMKSIVETIAPAGKSQLPEKTIVSELKNNTDFFNEVRPEYMVVSE